MHLPPLAVGHRERRTTRRRTRDEIGIADERPGLLISASTIRPKCKPGTATGTGASISNAVVHQSDEDATCPALTISRAGAVIGSSRKKDVSRRTPRGSPRGTARGGWYHARPRASKTRHRVVTSRVWRENSARCAPPLPRAVLALNGIRSHPNAPPADLSDRHPRQHAPGHKNRVVRIKTQK